MTIAFWCLLIACILPYIAVGIAKMDKIGKTDVDFAKLLGVIRAELVAAQDIRRAA